MAVGFCAIVSKMGEATDEIAGPFRKRWSGLKAIRIETASGPGFHFLVAHRQSIPLIAETDRYAVLLAGRIYGEKPEGPHPSASDLLDAYALRGEAALEGLNGVCTAVVYDKAERRLVAATDRSGNARAYWWEDDARLVLCSQYTPLFRSGAVRPEFAEEGLAEYLCHGCNLEDRTLFRDIRYLQGRRLLRHADGRTKAAQYLDYVLTDGTATGSVEDYGREYLELLTRSLRRRIGDAAILPITGGMDARLLACAASRVVEPGSIDTFTIGAEWAFDVRDGRRIARMLGYAHETAPISPCYFQNYVPEGVERTDAAIIGHTCWRISADDYLAPRIGTPMLSGCWGEFLRVHRDRPDIDPNWSIDELFRHHKKVHKEWMFMAEEKLADLLRPEVYKRVDGFVDANLRRLFIDAPAEHRRHKSEHMSTSNWWPRRYGRMVADYFTDACPVALPFNDTELLDFSFRVPLDVRKNGAINRWIFRTLFPKVGAIPHATTAMPVAAGPAGRLYHRVKGFAYYKALPKLSGGRWGTKNRAAYIHYRKWLREHNSDFVREAFSDLGPLEAYLNPDALRKATDDVLEGRSGDYGKVYNIAALVVYLRGLAAG